MSTGSSDPISICPSWMPGITTVPCFANSLVVAIIVFSDCHREGRRLGSNVMTQFSFSTLAINSLVAANDCGDRAANMPLICVILVSVKSTCAKFSLS